MCECNCYHLWKHMFWHKSVVFLKSKWNLAVSRAVEQYVMGLLSHRHFIQRRFNFIITEPEKVYPPLEYQVPSQGQPSFQQQGQGMPAFPPSYETHPPVITQQPRKMILQSLLPWTRCLIFKLFQKRFLFKRHYLRTSRRWWIALIAMELSGLA